MLLPAACSSEASLLRSLGSGSAALSAVLGSVCLWEGSAGKDRGKISEKSTQGPSIAMAASASFMVSPINPIIHLLFPAIGTFISKQTKENIKSPHGKMFFSCAGFSLTRYFVKRLMRITDGIKRTGSGGEAAMSYSYVL